jgi:hypothetical protein
MPRKLAEIVNHLISLFCVLRFPNWNQRPQALKSYLVEQKLQT